jgi:hypothetical protein
MKYKVDKDELVTYTDFDDFIDESPLFEIFKKCRKTDCEFSEERPYGVIFRDNFEEEMWDRYELDIDEDLLYDLDCDNDGTLDALIYCFDPLKKPFKLYLCHDSADGILYWTLLNFRKEIEQRITEYREQYGVRK